MKKPITVAREDFTISLIDLINNAEIPAFVIADVLSNALNEVRAIAEQQLMQDKKSWEDANKENVE